MSRIRFFSRFLVLFIPFISLFGIESSAKKEQVLSEYRLNGLPGDSIVRVADTGYQNNSSLIERSRLTRNIVSLYYDEGSTQYLGAPFEVVVRVGYTLKNYNGSTTGTQVLDSLRITYDTAGGYALRDYRVFDNILESSVKILGITYPSGFDPRGAIKLSNAIQVDRSYIWTPGCQVSTAGLSYQPGLPAQGYENNAFDELPVSWTPVLAADEYDLEWIWVDSSTGKSTPVILDGFRNNATRVSLEVTGYRIPLIYDGKGWLYFRVRPVKVLDDGTRLAGLWTNELAANAEFAFNGFQRKLNWQSTTSFAEEGKRKTVVNYFDGTLRSRQTVTKDNSTTILSGGEEKNNTVIAETFYDYQGRASIQVLPAPSTNTLLSYARGFNKNINNADYDKDDFDKLGVNEDCCGKVAGGMGDSLSGASQYYSVKSPFLTLDAAKSYSKFVPDAQKFPFIQTEYSLDNTGRITRQGGVGPNYQLGKHDTRYYYGKPFQQELDVLFGTEAGLEQHYFKNMVRDANGQFSISYMDMHGRTIATALAGRLVDSMRTKIDSLDDAHQFSYTIPLIKEGKQQIDGYSSVTTEGIVVPVRGQYSFKYNLSPEALKLENCALDSICYDCLYDFEISLIEECGDTAFYRYAQNISLDTTVVKSILDTICNSKGFNFNWSDTLSEGSYTLVKRLSINKASLAKYRDSIFMAQNVCRDYNSFLQQEIDSLKLKMPCIVTCEDCFAGIGSLESFTANYLAEQGEYSTEQGVQYIKEAALIYDEAYRSCQSLCPESDTAAVSIMASTRREMLLDMTPPMGQYADSAGLFIYRVLSTNPSHALYKVLYYQDPSLVYYDATGKRDTVLNAAGQWVTPNKLPREEFEEQFKSSWAETLLPGHPEYCKLLRGELWEASYIFDARMDMTDNYDSALARGYMNPPSTSKDPALNSNLIGGTSTFRNLLTSSLLNYRPVPNDNNRRISIWNFAPYIGVNCLNKDNCSIPFRSNTITETVAGTTITVNNLCAGDKDIIWQTYRSLYLAEKERLLYDVMSAGCTEAPAGYMKHFIQPTYGSGTRLAAENEFRDSVKSTIDSACHGYVEFWMADLENCRYTAAQWTSLTSHLTAICKKGGDLDHIGGAASLSPTESYSYASSFVAAVSRFNSENGINTTAACNGYLIQTPEPYDKSTTKIVNTPVYMRPADTSCLCLNLKKYDAERIASQNDSLTLGSYLRTFYNADMADSTVYQLLTVCNTPADTACKYLPYPVIVGPILNVCDENVPPCVDCNTIDYLYNQFVNEFGGAVPGYNPEDSLQMGVNTSFGRFMNYHTGFSFDYQKYLDFRRQCVDEKVLDCGSLDSIYTNFKNSYYRQPVMQTDSATGCNISYWNSNYGGGYAQDVPLNAIIDNGAFKPFRRGNLYSSLDFRDTMDFAPFTFESRLKFPRTGHRYNPISGNYTYQIQFTFKNTVGGQERMQFAVDLISDTVTRFYNLYDVTYPNTGPHVYRGNFNDWRNLKVEVHESFYRLYIDGVFFRQFNHRPYAKFEGISIESYGESLRIDEIKLLNGSGDMVLNEGFNSVYGCSGFDYMKRKLTDSPDCRTAFRDYFNSANGRSLYYSSEEIDSIYLNSCSRVLDVCSPVTYPGSKCILENVSATDSTLPVVMRTTLGNPTPAVGPKGVFNLAGKLIGVTADGSELAIKKSFVSIWNADTLNVKTGVLKVDSLAAGYPLSIQLKPGKQLPCDGIIGMRYYSFDTENDAINGIHVSKGSYVDWGDGSGIFTDKNQTSSKTTVRSFDPVGKFYDYTPLTAYNDYNLNLNDSLLYKENQYKGLRSNEEISLPETYSANHLYGKDSLWTIRVFHADTLGVVGNMLLEGDSLMNLVFIKNLRGYFPEHLNAWYSYSVLDSTYNTNLNIVNFNSIKGLEFFGISARNMINPGNFNEIGDHIDVPFGTYINLSGKSSLRKIIFDIREYSSYSSSMRSLNNLQNIAEAFAGVSIATILKDIHLLPVLEEVHLTGGYTTDLKFEKIQSLKVLELSLSPYTDYDGINVFINIMGDSVRACGLNLILNRLDRQHVLYLKDIQESEDSAAIKGLKQLAEKGVTVYIEDGLTDLKLHPVNVCKKVDALKLCGRSQALFPRVEFVDDPPCADTANIAGSIATLRYNAYLDSLRNAFDSAYLAKCMKAFDKETLEMTYPSYEYHYTLYYYDLSGNLVRTVPPEGVNLFRKSIRVSNSVELGIKALATDIENRRKTGRHRSLKYTLATQYRYNTLNQVIEQWTPDADTSRFWYDELGRLVVSQNAKQAKGGKYSYTLYDVHGRITEVGETGQRPAISQTITRDPAQLLTWLNTNISTKPLNQITQTVYDVAAELSETGMDEQRFSQGNLRNRVSFSKVIDSRNSALSSLTVANNNSNYRQATIYDYDIHGNVKNLLHDYRQGAMADAGLSGLNRFKQVRYDYDLISGKVNMVSYQPGYYNGDVTIRFKDLFYHKYEYDAENKLTAVYTSSDSVYWEKDAAYKYYRHGPLARTEIGHAKVQGLDYAYTLQGWLKGVNSTFSPDVTNRDIGEDGKAAPSGGGNNLFARDAVGFALHYNMADYKMIGSGLGAFIGLPNASFHAVYTPMYNGNIIGMTVNYDSSIRSGISTNNFIYGFGQPRTRMYKYDKLNRLRAVMDLPFSGTGNNAGNTVEYNVAGGLSETFTYDGNGNILRLIRNTPTNVSPPSGAGHFQTVDNLTYNYKAGTNRLRHVGETTNKDLFNFDIDPQVADNYVYDEIGNLIKDSSENISRIAWTVYGKIDSIYKHGGSTLITYSYDAAGNRISKRVKVGANTTETWYVRDAQGNVLNVYSYNAGEGLSLAETHLYGSSRLGIMNRDINVSDGTGLEQISYTISGDIFWGKKYNFDRGNKLFETSNHLGNVLVAFSDRKKAFKNATNPNVIAYYKADICSANDYYAFGAPIPIFSFNSSSYRYGFNGKEKDNEVSGEGNQYDYGFRIYNPRLGRFLSIDPLEANYPYFSPYQYSGNMPILSVDVDGLEPAVDPNIVQVPLIAHHLPPVEIVGYKKLTGWEKLKAFSRGFIKAAATTVVVIAGVTAVVASAGAAGPFILAGVIAYGTYETGKASYEVISGKEAFTGRKLSEEEQYELGGNLVGGFVAGGIYSKARIKSNKVTEGIGEKSPVKDSKSTSETFQQQQQAGFFSFREVNSSQVKDFITTEPHAQGTKALSEIQNKLNTKDLSVWKEPIITTTYKGNTYVLDGNHRLTVIGKGSASMKVTLLELSEAEAMKRYPDKMKDIQNGEFNVKIKDND